VIDGFFRDAPHFIEFPLKDVLLRAKVVDEDTILFERGHGPYVHHLPVRSLGVEWHSLHAICHLEGHARSLCIGGLLTDGLEFFL
jgi:hypothetical protein